jgi:hypothetical protein
MSGAWNVSTAMRGSRSEHNGRDCYADDKVCPTIFWRQRRDLTAIFRQRSKIGALYQKRVMVALST